ncbi:hypothetical protein BSLG_006836 [Batrachochytrium salamandrivorans]|nr:hypothetical protein BSLG_006836 [Batrachochytrium salamandrivorans]
MNLPLLFDTVVLHAHEAKKLYLLGDLHSACRRTGEALRGATALLEILSNPSEDSADTPTTPDLALGHPCNGLADHQEPVDVYEEEDMQEKFTPNSMLSHPAIMQALDDIFFDFLASICSDLDAHDRYGVKIHHTLTALKVSRLAETGGFARFKVRIKSFTQAFTDQVERLKPQFPQLVNVHRHILQSYLLQQKYLCRFSEESKKFKSNGFLVWVVGARKTVQNGKVQWEFRDFVPDIVGPEPSSSIRIGECFAYKPRVYDPQSLDTAVVFHSPWLPYWLQWQGSTLHGVPDINSQSCEITVVASFKSISGSEILPLV